VRVWGDQGEAEEVGGADLMVRPLSDLAQIASDLPKQLKAAEQRGVRRSALLVTGGVRDEIRGASGGDMRLSGVGRRGARVGAKFTVGGGSDPTAIIRATGPLHLIERDTDPHGIRPKRRSKAKALRLANGMVRASANHPGTRGKHPWQKGLNRTRPGTRKVFTDEIHNAMIKAIR
jgi:hypothetical protein